MSDTTELLAELATVDEVTAELATSMDGDLGRVPQWCELLLTINRVDDGSLNPAWPLNARLPLRRHDGELIIEALHEVLHPYSTNAVEGIWSELDAVVERIQGRIARDKEPLKADVGQALGLAVALAHITARDLDSVRSEAMERWEAQA